MTQASRTGAARPDTPLATSLFADGFEPFETITTTETYVYDAHGHRTRSSRSDGSTRYQIYSRAGQLLYVEDSRDNQRIDYIHLGGKLIAQRSRSLNTSTATTTYHHTDHIQSATIETNTAGTQTQRTVRTPYGSPYNGIYREGPGYAGHVTDTQTNLTYMQQRYYDPVALRFLSPDPVDVSASDGGNFNRYWYANNNPYRYVDPDGRAACSGQRMTNCIEASTRIGALRTSVNTSSEINQAIKDTAPLVAVPGNGPEKGVFIAASADGTLIPVTPANAEPGRTSSTNTLTMTVPAGVVPVAANHGHIDSGPDKSRGLASPRDGRTTVLAGYPVGVVSQGNVAVVTAPDGRLRIQALEGSIDRRDVRAIQRFLDEQQRALLEEQE